jgi:thioredoxin-like negative regulator of GroEL
MKTFIRFHAEWCAPCKASEKNWETFKSKNESKYVFVDANVDEASSVGMIKNFNISSVPTIVVTNEKHELLAQHTGIFKVSDLERLG